MNIMELTEQNFDQVVTNNEIVVIDFWAEWCGPCKSFASIYDEVAKLHSDVVFGKVNIEEQPSLKDDFGVRSIPLVMILKQKVVVFHQPGLLPSSALNDLVAQAKALDMTKVYAELDQADAKKPKE